MARHLEPFFLKGDLFRAQLPEDVVRVGEPDDFEKELVLAASKSDIIFEGCCVVGRLVVLKWVDEDCSSGAGSLSLSPPPPGATEQ